MKRTKETNRTNLIENNVGAGPVSAQKGITLIALVITIIVMLILVAVTISMTVNGGLFEYAGKAVGDTKNALDAEQELSNGKIQVNGVWYDSIDDYLAGKPAVVTIHSWTRSGDEFTCAHCNKTYTMGETVSYTSTGTSTVYLDKLGFADEEENEISITSQNTTWVVLGIQDTNGDDVNETLLITSATPLNVLDSETGLSMGGAAAYNNGESEINRICKELYSNNTYGEARGMTIEDVNSALNFTPLGGMYYDTAVSTTMMKTTGNFTTQLKDLQIWDNIKSNGTYTPDGTNTPEALGEYVLNGYNYILGEDGLSLSNMVNDVVTTITETERNLIFGSSKEYIYWLATTGVGGGFTSNGTNYSEVVWFGIGRVGYGFVRSKRG